jgi:hypothetical protein
MPLVIRGRHAYYYKKQRVGSKVISTYFGKDEEARIIARVDDILRYAAKLRADNRKARRKTTPSRSEND